MRVATYATLPTEELLRLGAIYFSQQHITFRLARMTPLMGHFAVTHSGRQERRRLRLVTAILAQRGVAYPADWDIPRNTRPPQAR